MSSSTTSVVVDTTTTTTAVSTSISTTTTEPPTTTAAAAPTTTTTTPPPTTVTSTLPPSTSVTSVAPTSTTIVPPPTVVPSTSIIPVTYTVTQSPTNSAQIPSVVIITSTQAVVTTPPVSTSSTRPTSSSTSAAATQSALSASSNATASKGLSSGATIAIAVIIPIVAVAALIIFGILFWRRRRNRKNAEELRKNEMAEYGFNPNNDPTLPVGAVAYTDGGSEANDDSGYRGWGATTVSRNAPTTMGSNSRGAPMGSATGALSDGGSQAGGYNHPSPSAAGGSDGTQEPLMQGHHDNGIPAAMAGGAAGAVAGGATLAALNAHSARNQRFSNSIHRGPSNASSAYSAGGALSEVSSEHNPVPGPYPYHEEVPYNVYNDGQNPYGDGQHADNPVIRDVQARRNTRIEKAPTFPQQGGIAQNF